MAVCWTSSCRYSRDAPGQSPMIGEGNGHQWWWHLVSLSLSKVISDVICLLHMRSSALLPLLLQLWGSGQRIKRMNVCSEGKQCISRDGEPAFYYNESIFRSYLLFVIRTCINKILLPFLFSIIVHLHGCRKKCFFPWCTYLRTNSVLVLSCKFLQESKAKFSCLYWKGSVFPCPFSLWILFLVSLKNKTKQNNLKRNFQVLLVRQL